MIKQLCLGDLELHLHKRVLQYGDASSRFTSRQILFSGSYVGLGFASVNYYFPFLDRQYYPIKFETLYPQCILPDIPIVTIPKKEFTTLYMKTNFQRFVQNWRD